MRVEVDEGSPTATLTIEFPASGAVSYVTMSSHQLRPLVTTLAQALNPSYSRQERAPAADVA